MAPADGYINIPIYGIANWRAPVLTSADLPLIGNSPGDAIAAEDTGVIYVWNGTSWVAPSGSGTVTSVAVTAPSSILSVSGSPITGAGIISLSLVSQTANKVFASPNGSSGLPTFRALVAADIPSLSYVSSIGVDAPLTSSGGLTPTLSITQASTSSNGYLSSTDWNTFNGKQAAGNYITALTGDVTASGPGSAAATLSSQVSAVYVDFIEGNDSTGTGTAVRPWKTLQHAYNSISPSINQPYTIYLSGGNNDTDTAITAKPNVNIIAPYQIQISATFTISGGTTNDNCTFQNLTFVGQFTWSRNDGSEIGLTLLNCEFFNGPTLEQTGSGACGITACDSVLVNSVFQCPNAFAFFLGCNFLGSTTTFNDSGANTYYEFLGGYNSSAISIAGGVDLAYFSGFVWDVAFGASLSFTTTASGTPNVQFDSSGLPSTYTGSANLTYSSFSQNESYTPADSTKWNNPQPTTVKQALDRIAAVVGAVTPIP